MTAAWLEVLDISGVPAEQYEACYAAAVQARAERRAAGENLVHLTADELAAEWLKIKRLHDEMQREEMKHRMLTENAPGACQRCLGTGKDSTPDGVIDCDHVPLTDEQKAARDALRDEKLAWIRAEMKKVGAPKPPVRDAPKPPPGLWFKCDSCSRRLNVLRDMDGQRCGDLLNRGTHEGELRLCEGTMHSV
ncbi:MAG TPA: hypothetical protein VF297_05080 [Pyrinomonadaceae bacterium]